MQTTHLSLEKALDILSAFMPHNNALGTQEISLKMGLHKSTANRLLHVLTSRGFLQQDISTKKFSLGPAIAHLGSALTNSLSEGLTRIAVPFIDALRDRVGETVVLETASSKDTIITYLAEGQGPVRIRATIGRHYSYNAAAGAKAILAFSDPEFVERILSAELQAMTPHTQTDPTQVLDDLQTIRKRGFSFEKEENNLGISAFGCPVFNFEGKPVAAIVVAGATQSVAWERRKEIVPALKETANTISEQLYFGKRRQA